MGERGGRGEGIRRGEKGQKEGGGEGRRKLVGVGGVCVCVCGGGGGAERLYSII